MLTVLCDQYTGQHDERTLQFRVSIFHGACYYVDQNTIPNIGTRVLLDQNRVERIIESEESGSKYSIEARGHEAVPWRHAADTVRPVAGALALRAGHVLLATPRPLVAGPHRERLITRIRHVVRFGLPRRHPAMMPDRKSLRSLAR
jgi:hypothetical protein